MMDVFPSGGGPMDPTSGWPTTGGGGAGPLAGEHECKELAREQGMSDTPFSLWITRRNGKPHCQLPVTQHDAETSELCGNALTYTERVMFRLWRKEYFVPFRVFITLANDDGKEKRWELFMHYANVISTSPIALKQYWIRHLDPPARHVYAAIYNDLWTFEMGQPHHKEMSDLLDTL